MSLNFILPQPHYFTSQPMAAAIDAATVRPELLLCDTVALFRGDGTNRVCGLLCECYAIGIKRARLAIAIIATNEHATVFEARLLHADNIGRWQYMCTDSHALIGLATLLRTPHEVRPVVIPASSDERLALVLSTSAARTLAEGYESARDVAVSVQHPEVVAKIMKRLEAPAATSGLFPEAFDIGLDLDTLLASSDSDLPWPPLIGGRVLQHFEIRGDHTGERCSVGRTCQNGYVNSIPVFTCGNGHTVCSACLGTMIEAYAEALRKLRTSGADGAPEHKLKRMPQMQCPGCDHNCNQLLNPIYLYAEVGKMPDATEQHRLRTSLRSMDLERSLYITHRRNQRAK